MNREFITANAEVIQADTEELFAVATAKGIKMPHPALTIFSCLLCEIEEANENDVRLGEEATIKAVDTAIGTQINWNHIGKGNICGHIIDAEIRDKKDVWITCVGFKEEYEDEFEYAQKLMRRKKLAMSFEISADKESQDKLSDGTRRINDYYFTGAGLLLGVQPACNKAYVQEMAKKIEIERRELVLANKSTKSIIDSIIKIVNDSEKINANYKCECLDCGKQISASQHCKDIKCPECGGAMRRADRPSKDNNKQGGNKVEIAKLKKTITEELGEEIVANWTDEDFQNEDKVTEARQAKEKSASKETTEVESASTENEEANRTVETESTSKSTSVVDDDGKEVTTEEVLVVQSVDGKEVYRRKTNEERMYAESEVEAVKADFQKKIDELTASLETKGSEIEEVRANAEKIGQLKVQYKDNQYTAEFKDEDWLNDEKIQEAVSKKEKAEKIAQNKETLKDNEFAKDFSDEDYADETKVELANLKAENKSLKEKKEDVVAEETSEKEKVEAKKDESMKTGTEAEVNDEFAEVSNPVSRVILRARKEKKEKINSKK